MNLALIRKAIAEGNYEISVHAFQRMRQRGIKLADIEDTILTGEMIEQDLNAKPFPKCIFLGYTIRKGEAIHVVCSFAPVTRLVTIYFPEEDQWSRQRFRRR